MARVYLWNRDGNTLTDTLFLFKTGTLRYDQQPTGCEELPLKVSRIEYSGTFDFPEDDYTSRRGFYFVYERCCRNNVINNLTMPGETGQAFYLEVPTFGLEFRQFINSSPELPTFPVEYLPLNQPWLYDLTAVDPDGDQLKYSLVRPLAGNSTQQVPNPPPYPAPYTEAEWAAGYSLTNIIPGNPSLSNMALEGNKLEFTPTKTGLYVVAVRVEEFRDGRKIGEVRREFQVVVYAPENRIPEIAVTEGERSLSGDTPIPVVDVYPGQLTRLAIFGSDPDGDRISLTARGTTLSGDPVSLSILGINFIKAEGIGEAEQQLTWQPSCQVFRNRPDTEFIVEFQVEDQNLCRNPGFARQAVRLRVLLPADHPPQLQALLPESEQPDSVYTEIEVGERFDLLLEGTDGNLADNLLLQLVENPLSENTWPEVSGVGSLEALFSVEATCETLQGAKERKLDFVFRLTDEGCLESGADSLKLTVLVKEPPQDFDTVVFPNMFSPNDDEYNQTFYIDRLPEDVCTNNFQYIRIYNRWGKTVFFSRDKQFVWYANGIPGGVYFYEIRYSNWEYTSSLALMRGTTP
jgi:gliding motility-associated-like protein